VVVVDLAGGEGFAGVLGFLLSAHASAEATINTRNAIDVFRNSLLGMVLLLKISRLSWPFLRGFTTENAGRMSAS
jgi:hypothetical protein